MVSGSSQERSLSAGRAIAMFFCFTAASFGQQVKTDYDHNAEFGKYKTFSWERSKHEIRCWSTASRTQ